MPAPRRGLTLDNLLAFPATLPNTRSSASAARHLLHDALRGDVPDDVIDDVVLMVSELVTNAIDNGGGPCGLALSIPRPDVLRVAVTDQNQSHPRMPGRDVAADSGRGLQLIQSMALRWGHHRRPGTGNTVWFEVLAPCAA